jgi:hypothetical protein
MDFVGSFSDTMRGFFKENIRLKLVGLGRSEGREKMVLSLKSAVGLISSLKISN